MRFYDVQNIKQKSTDEKVGNNALEIRIQIGNVIYKIPVKFSYEQNTLESPNFDIRMFELR